MRVAWSEVAVGLLLLSALAACQEVTRMDRIEQLWGRVTASQESSEEAQAVAELESHLREGGIAFRATLLQEDGREVPFNELTEDDTIREVRMTFFLEDDSLALAGWFPRDEENLFMLFRE